MRHFWRDDDLEGTSFGPRQHHHHVPVLARVYQPFAGQNEHPGADKEALFRARDWVKVKELLEAGKVSANPEDARDELTAAVTRLRASLRTPVLRAAPIIDQLVDVWALAEQVDPGAAKPAEALLCAMEGCDLVAAGQVSAACDQVGAVLTASTRSASHAGARRQDAEGLELP